MRASYLLWGLVLLAGVAGVAQGGAIEMDQPVVSPTNTPQVVQQTTAAMSLFVDPTGSDSNACTASGTSACATPNGALAKVPGKIAHAVTITVADGTYSSLQVYGFQFTNGGSLAITGNVVTATGLASGTATGTLSALSNTAVPVPSVTDGTQSWTADNLKGLYIRMTNGTASAQRRIIATNTGTVITPGRPYSTAPTVGDAYVIERPGAILNAASNAFIVAGCTGTATLSGSVAITITGFETTSSSLGVQAFNNAGVNMTLNTIRAATGGMSFTNHLGTLTLQNVYASGGSNFSKVLGVVTNTSGNFMVTGSSAGAPILLFSQAAIQGGGVVENTSSTGKALGLNSATGVKLTLTAGVTGAVYWNLRCASGSTGSVGVEIDQPYSFTTLQNVNISNCVTGVQAAYDSIIGVFNAGISNATTGLRGTKGGSIHLLGGGCPTFTTVTNETQLEATNAACAGLIGANCFINAVSGAKICE